MVSTHFPAGLGFVQLTPAETSVRRSPQASAPDCSPADRPTLPAISASGRRATRMVPAGSTPDAGGASRSLGLERAVVSLSSLTQCSARRALAPPFPSQRLAP